MNQLATRDPTNEPLSLSAAQVVAQARLIQEVMRAVMHEGTHYGTIPGCKQPSLYKAGSEVILTTFRIAVEPEVNDLSTADEVRYRVRAVGRHQTTGIVVGIGVGECSSGEDKYKWRAAVCDAEFEATPEDRRRVKYGKAKGGGFYTAKQVRTSPADIANTALKMAKKRAQIDLTLTATAASDIFTQDIEDLPEELRQDESAQRPAQPALAPYPADSFTSNLPAWRKLVVDGTKTVAAILTTVKTRYTLTPEQEQQIKALANPAPAQPATTAPPTDNEWGAAYDKREIENQEKRDATT